MEIMPVAITRAKYAGESFLIPSFNIELKVLDDDIIKSFSDYFFIKEPDIF